MEASGTVLLPGHLAGLPSGLNTFEQCCTKNRIPSFERRQGKDGEENGRVAEYDDVDMYVQSAN